MKSLLKRKIFNICFICILVMINSVSIFADGIDYDEIHKDGGLLPKYRFIDGVLSTDDQEAKVVEGEVIEQDQGIETKFSSPIDWVVKSLTSENNAMNTTLLLDVNNNEWKLIKADADGKVTYMTNTYYIDKTRMQLGIDMSPTVYCFDGQGKMIVGWMQDEKGDWRFFSTKNDVNRGKMAMGWAKIGSYWYCFGPEGVMMRNMMTKEGKILDIDGRCINYK